MLIQIKFICITILLLFCAFLSHAQHPQSVKKKEALPDMLFTHRLQRAIHLDAVENKNLSHLYYDRDSNVSIITLLIEALMSNNIRAYYQMKDTAAFLSREQAMQILTETKTITGKDFTPSVINTLIFFEDWYLDKNTRKAKHELMLAAPAIQYDEPKKKQQILFYIRPSDFAKICESYYIKVADKNDTALAVTLNEYFTERYFVSDIQREEIIQIEYEYTH